MTPQRSKKWWRPRFSIRTLAVLIVLICGYAACWGPTKNQGVEDVYNHPAANHSAIPTQYRPLSRDDIHAALPFILTQEYYRIQWRGAATKDTYRRYYFWFFGYVVELHERKLKTEPGPVKQWAPAPEVPADE